MTTYGEKKGIPEDFDFEEFSKEAVTKYKQGKELNGKGGILTPLINQILESALDAELSQHLVDAKVSASNRRYGYNRKQVKSTNGGFELSTSRYCDGCFEPVLVKKRLPIVSTTLENKIIGLYNLGMSFNDIRDYIDEMYGFDISQGMLSQITDKIIPEIREWQNRALSQLYPIIWMDAIHYHVRENGAVTNRAVYSIIGVNIYGQKELLGINMSENEGSKFWQQVLTPEIRRMIYTTTIIQGYHPQLRKVTKTKGAFAKENVLLKLIYLASMRIIEK